METEKRKTYTSTAVKRRYNAKTYKRIAVDLPKKLVEDWEAELEKLQISKASFVRDAIEKFLQKN